MSILYTLFLPTLGYAKCNSSAYIKPFEEEMKEWEDKLLSMQDILDAWLRCQESWLYLEPIFNSEDIMKQMPVEGRKFNKV